LIVIFNLYTIYQQILIKRLRRQLAEKQSHSDILRNLALLDPLTCLYKRRFAEQRLAAEVSREVDRLRTGRKTANRGRYGCLSL
jgi:GGDEF domain-containing protein